MCARPIAGAGPDVSLTEDLLPYLSLLGRLKQGCEATEAATSLLDQALDIWARPGFETFMSVPRLRFEPFPYQLRAA